MKNEVSIQFLETTNERLFELLDLDGKNEKCRALEIYFYTWFHPKETLSQSYETLRGIIRVFYEYYSAVYL